MLAVGDMNYPLCLLDTMAVSEMVKRPQSAFRHFLDWSHAGQTPFVPCFTVYTLIELRRKPEHFQQFIEQFSSLPLRVAQGIHGASRRGSSELPRSVPNRSMLYRIHAAGR
jgi:hypothetical protein